jgi:hypothetical protein
MVEGSCKVTIEGCMTEGSVNYDPQANTMISTWCVPKVEGCMMPSKELSTAFPHGTVKSTDGLALNFNYAATVHNATSCTVYREGCMHSAASNYDPLATIQAVTGNGACYFNTYGAACLNPMAVNFGCGESDFDANGQARGDSPCVCSAPGCPTGEGGTWLYGTVGGTEGWWQTRSNIHSALYCKYVGEPAEGMPLPPSPPPPSAPRDGQNWKYVTTHVVETVCVVKGTIATVTNLAPALMNSLSTAVGNGNCETILNNPVSTTLNSGARTEGPLYLTTADGGPCPSVRRLSELQTASQAESVTTTISIE